MGSSPGSPPCESLATRDYSTRDYLAEASPQSAVVDDERGVILLNGGVEPRDPIGRWSSRSHLTKPRLWKLVESKDNKVSLLKERSVLSCRVAEWIIGRGGSKG